MEITGEIAKNGFLISFLQSSSLFYRDLEITGEIAKNGFPISFLQSSSLLRKRDKTIEPGDSQSRTQTPLKAVEQGDYELRYTFEFAWFKKTMKMSEHLKPAIWRS